MASEQYPFDTDSAGMEISGTGDIPDSAPHTHRAVALDILRGLAILMMVFSGCIPFDKPLPSWLFHAQEPTTFDQFHNAVHIFDPTHPGITFVDLVFPTFLFSLGAAIPLALSKKLDRGASVSSVILGGAARMIQLSWFAVYLGNIRPNNIHDHPVLSTWLFALLGFALMFPMFTRLPADWKLWQRALIRTSGYIGGFALLVFLSQTQYYPKGSGFQLSRVDVIIVALADMAFFGTLIWVCTRHTILARIGVVAILLAIRLGSSQQGWLHDIWTFAPKNTGFLFAFDYLKYLFIVIPGTIAGDMIHCWTARNSPSSTRSSTARLLSFVLLTMVLTGGILYGYETRLLWQTAVFTTLCCAAIGWLLVSPADDTERLIKNMASWGTFWLVAGVLLEPFEGGIKKDPSTLSYYFITGGIAFVLLAALLTVTAIYKIEKPFAILAYSGQNPMIAYVMMGNFILPVLALSHIQPLIDHYLATPWLGVAAGGAETSLLAYFVSCFSARNVYWRT